MRISVHRMGASVAGLVIAVANAAHAQGPWHEARHAHYSIFYHKGFEQDAHAVQGWADRTERLMKSKYDVRPTRFHMNVYLFAEPNSTVDVSHAHNVCCTTSDDGVNVGRIEMLAPSAPAMQAYGQLSSLGMPKNDTSYEAKIFVSEYIPIGHLEVQKARPAGGWQYYDAPNWFVQGLQEFDAIFHSTQRNRTENAQRLMAWAQSHPNAFRCCNPDLTIADAYNGGAAFMAFLAQEFGEDVHRRLLASGAPSFSTALTDVTRPYTRRELFARFQVWVRAPTVSGLGAQ